MARLHRGAILPADGFFGLGDSCPTADKADGGIKESDAVGFLFLLGSKEKAPCLKLRPKNAGGSHEKQDSQDPQQIELRRPIA